MRAPIRSSTRPPPCPRSAAASARRRRSARAKCVRGIKGEPVGIGRLERFVADWHNAQRPGEAPAARAQRPQGRRHRRRPERASPARAILPSKGYDVTVFEALHTAGGVLVYGIPEFRLPKAIVQKEIDSLQALGVKVETNMVIGKVAVHRRAVRASGLRGRVHRLRRGSAHASWTSPARTSSGVYSANEFLTRINLMKAYQQDSSDTPDHARAGQRRRRRRRQRRHGRRALRQAPGRGEGVHRLPPRHGGAARPPRGGRARRWKRASSSRLLNNPVEILGDENGLGLRAIDAACEMELGEPDASGRRRPIEKVGSEHDLPVGLRSWRLPPSAIPRRTRSSRTTTPGLEVEPQGRH